MKKISGEKTKKTALAFLAAALITSLPLFLQAKTASAAGATVYINGKAASGDVLFRNGRTYLTLTDMRALGGYSFRYNKTWKTITITGGEDGARHVLTLGSREARRNGQSLTLEAAPLSYENKTMIPVRVAAQLFDAELEWDSNGNRVMLTKDTESEGSSARPPASPSRPPVPPPGPSGPSVPKPPTPPSVR
ncbi:copper amine oxidase N-terminal domain-containing protein [Saccharibacillus deserti]|uniref:copper amine oxidase N-terminal domain-containing protein n=1 Tax=Saccharibacillus deserti TaxID=1634444 RepID=UPI0015565E43|nr:copper amine oxidase N-terminal domain-containing protein [Saccharibacillus deserti]